MEQSRTGPELEVARRREDEFVRRAAADEAEAFDDCMHRKGYVRVARPTAER